jgi:superfamily II DNA helicase RecQ
MKYRMFTYSVNDDGEMTELNSFLSSRRVLDVKYHAADDGSKVVFMVEYIDGKCKVQDSSRPRIDYRDRLPEEQFHKFSKLRDLRKQVADDAGIPVYNVFTNAQLAEMVESKIVTESELRKVAGVGKSRVDKYGESFLVLLRELMDKKT